MKDKPNKATVKDGLPTAEQIMLSYVKGIEVNVLTSEKGQEELKTAIIHAMQSYSDQQNAELREQNRKNQSRWAKDRVEQDKKHESAMMEACGKIVDLEERVKELEGALTATLNVARAYDRSRFVDILDKAEKTLKK